MTAATEGVASTRAMLERSGYTVNLEKNGYLTVKDPVHGIGRGGMLELRGYKSVVIRNHVEAIRFIDARS